MPERWEVREGDAFELLAALPDASVDAVVTDPPYGLEFMGKEWDSFRLDDRSARWASRSGEAGGFGDMDSGSSLPNYGRRRTTSRCLACGKRDAFRNPHACGAAAQWVIEYVDVVPVEMRAFQHWCYLWALEALRVLKPGGHLLAFGGSRTYHRLACALEDAGFDVRDSLMWLYGSGFPKSFDVSKGIDKAAGAEREVVGVQERQPREAEGPTFAQADRAERFVYSLPATEDAERWDGWGTALKPAHEPVVMARKPLVGSVVENVLEHGTGALNIDATRVGAAGGTRAVGKGQASAGVYGDGLNSTPSQAIDAGRWPANVVLAHHPDCAGYGTKRSLELCHPDCPARMLDEQSGSMPDRESGTYVLRRQGGEDITYDGGGASRFFYCAKAQRRERIAGTLRNLHPTVKPVELMRWLARLVTPPGGLVLDPFLGSGSTGCAAVAEGFRFLGFEREADYAQVARERIADWAFAHPLRSAPDHGNEPS